MNNLIPLHTATIGKVSTMSDKTVKVELYLRELPIEQMTLLMHAYMTGSEGFEIKDQADDGKTPSQRLKRTLYKNWEQNTDKSLEFESHYRQEMGKIINHYKSKLN